LKGVRNWLVKQCNFQKLVQTVQRGTGEEMEGVGGGMEVELL
jgi:hypothetical protein